MSDSDLQEVNSGARVGNGGVVGWCILLLMTIIIPWTFLVGHPVWSWVVLDTAPKAFGTFVIGEWIIAGVVAILARFLWGLPFSIVLVVSGAIGMFLMMGLAGKGTHSPLLPESKIFTEITPSGVPLEVVAMLSVLALYVFSNLRLRTGPNIPMNFLEGGAAVVCVVLVLIVFVPSAKDFAEQVNRSSLKTVLSGVGSILGAGLLAQIFILIAGLLAFINALVKHGEALGYARTAIGLIHAAMGIVLGTLIVVPGIASQNFLPSLAIAISIMLFLTMPVLLTLGAIRLAGDLVVAAKKTLTVVAEKA